MGTHLVNFADMRDKWRKKRVRRLKQAQKDARSLEVIDSPRNTADSTLTSRTMHPLPPPQPPPSLTGHRPSPTLSALPPPRGGGPGALGRTTETPAEGNAATALTPLFFVPAPCEGLLCRETGGLETAGRI